MGSAPPASAVAPFPAEREGRRGGVGGRGDSPRSLLPELRFRNRGVPDANHREPLTDLFQPPHVEAGVEPAAVLLPDLA